MRPPISVVDVMTAMGAKEGSTLTMVAKKDLDYYDQLAHERGGRCLSTEYIDSQTKYKWECKEGHRWEAKANDIQSGYWCRRCSGSEKKNLEYYDQIARKKGGRCLSTKYIDSHTKYEWICVEGHRWEATAIHIQNNRWCVKCAGLDKKNIEYYDKFAHAQGGRCLSTKYINALTQYEWECEEGHRWKATATDIQSGSWCPKCKHKQSKPEKVIFDLIQARFPDTQERIRGLLSSRRFELDIYISSLKKAIEFDGDFWHNRPESKERDNRKNRECKEAGIELLRILESDYNRCPFTEMSKVWRFLGVIQ